MQVYHLYRPTCQFVLVVHTCRPFVFFEDVSPYGVSGYHARANGADVRCFEKLDVDLRRSQIVDPDIVWPRED